MIKKIWVITLSLAMMLCMLACPINAAVVPQLSIENKTASAGTTVEVPIKISNSAGVYNGNFTLQYDSTKLSVEDYTIGTIFNGHTSMCNTDYQSTGNQIRFTFSGAYALKGDGTLVTLKFKAKASASGTANLQFTAYKIYNESGVSMSPTAANGAITISPKPVDPTNIPKLSIEEKTVYADNTVDVPVKISNSTGVYNGNFTLQYDSTKLNVESYTIGSVFNGHTTNCNLDYQSTGNQIRFTFSGAYALKGDGTLVTLKFKAKASASGTAALQFTAYKIYNESGVSMSPTAANGTLTISPKPVDPTTADVVVMLDTVTAKAGETVEINLTLNNSANIKSMSITDIDFDSQKIELLNGVWLVENTVINDWNSSNKTGAIAFNGNTAVNGKILKLTFKVLENVEDCEVTISCNLVAKTKPTSAETSLTTEVIPGKIVIRNVLRGDYNDDGYVDSDDAIYLLYATLISDSYPLNQSGDLNGDGYTDSDDAIYLLYYTLLSDSYPLK